MVSKVCMGDSASIWVMFRPDELVRDFTPLVWMIVGLKTCNGILISLCMKYADNIFLSYTKPASIILTMLTVSYLTNELPPPAVILGTVLVLSSMQLYRAR